jgi:hypothetical protein
MKRIALSLIGLAAFALAGCEDASKDSLTNGAGGDVGRALTVENFGTSTTLGGLNSTGTSTFSGAITLNKTATLTAAAGGTVDFTGILSGPGGLRVPGRVRV